MTRDYYDDGMRDGRGDAWRNGSEEYPASDGDRYSYRTGYEDGERRRKWHEEEEDY
jgi:hypothetical protein